MAAVSGLATTYNLQNYVGQLFRITPSDTPVATMMGGLNGGTVTRSKQFTWQTEDNAAAAQPDGLLEGADPTYAERDRSEVSNVVQIFQYGVKIGYSKLAAVDQLASDAQHILGMQPVQDELAHQLGLVLERAKRDLEYSVLRGSYQNPSDNVTGRKMRGLENAISTNEVDVSTTLGAATFDFTGGGVDDEWTLATHGLATGDEVYFSAVGTGATGFAVSTRYWVIYVNANTFQLASSLDNAIAGTAVEGTADSAGTWTLKKAQPLSKAAFDRLMRKMYESGAPFRVPVIVCGAYAKQAISNIYGYAPDSRNVGGLNIQQIETDLAGTVGIVVDRFMPAGKAFIADMSVLRLRFMPIQGKGVFFFEPLAQTGAALNWHLYGEIGLEYGPELWHGSLIGFTTDETA